MRYPPRNLPSNPFEDNSFYADEAASLGDALKQCLSSNTTLKTIAQNRAQLKKSVFNNINLDKKQLDVLAKSAETNIDHAKLYALYLFQQCHMKQNEDLTKYHKVLLKIAIEDRNPHALYLLAESELNSKEDNIKLLGKKHMEMLLNDPFYGEHVKNRLYIENVNSKRQAAAPTPASVSSSTSAFEKKPPQAVHPAEHVGKSNAQTFIELVERIVVAARQKEIKAALFIKVDEARQSNTKDNVLNYSGMLAELHFNTQAESLVKLGKKFFNISAQTTPQSKTIVRAITQYYRGGPNEAGDPQGAIKGLNDFIEKGIVPPKPPANEKIKSPLHSQSQSKK